MNATEMQRPRIVLLLLLASWLGPASRLGAQTLDVPALVEGQETAWRIENVPPGRWAALALSFQGEGAGPCFPSLGACLGLLPPIDVFPVSVDPHRHAVFEPVVPPLTAGLSLALQGLTFDPNGSRLHATPAVSRTVQPIGALGDEFAGNVLAPRWRILHPELVDAAVVSGALELVPRATGIQSTWYHDDEGTQIHQGVRGDFTVSARVTVDSLRNPGTPPPPDFRLAGLIVRDPRAPAGARNWFHLAIGGAWTPLPLALEVKHTVRSISQFALYPLPGAEAELRIRRRGATFTVSWRPPGGTWTTLETFARPDLGAELAVGPMVYSFAAPIDIRARFDFVRFEH